MNFPEELSHAIRTDEPLAPLVWLGIGGPARFFAEPLNAEEAAQLHAVAKENDLAVRILGGGSNVLVRESGFDGLVISLSAATTGLATDGNQMRVGAGAKLSHAVIKAVGSGLSGIEHLVGIPGTIGGAVYGNVFADGRDIGSCVTELTVLDADGNLKTVSSDEAGFAHRKSSLSGLTILEVVLQLEATDPAELTKRMQKLWISRNSIRPAEQRRIALPFVDPDGIEAKELIQSVGLAGVREGEVGLDSSQPSYMIAESGATSDQCLRLIERVREQVLLQTGIDLQLNLKIW